MLKRQGPLYEQIYEVLWQSLLDGEIGPGTKIRDTEWAARLGVSRTPVREALRKLEHDNVLEAQDHGGYRFRRLEPAELIELYDCRAVLEGLAAAKAATRVTADDIAALSALQQETQGTVERGDFQAALELTTAFHQRIIDASGQPHLSKLLHSLKRMTLLARALLLSSAQRSRDSHQAYADHMAAVLLDHDAILAALRTGDADSSERLMRNHLARTATDMQALIAERAAAEGAEEAG